MGARGGGESVTNLAVEGAATKGVPATYSKKPQIKADLSGAIAFMSLFKFNSKITYEVL
jgi:hypothetical protein